MIHSELSTMIDYIERLEMSERKNPFEYIVPPSPLKWGSEQLSGKFGMLYPGSSILLGTSFEIRVYIDYVHYDAEVYPKISALAKLARK